MKVAIDGTVQEAKADELLIDLINRTGGSVPHVCYHPQPARFRRVTHAWWE
jgi:NADH dehydrogenase/NADH:ubiquinone oxidoreductase subunit G